jgi:hypothetical protein
MIRWDWDRLLNLVGIIAAVVIVLVITVVTYFFAVIFHNC